jgi:hypothetical protein
LGIRLVRIEETAGSTPASLTRQQAAPVTG